VRPDEETAEAAPYVTLGCVSCSSCELGRHASQTARFCPFIIRRYAAGTELFEPGQRADYVWMVKEGVVGIRTSRDSVQRVDELRLPGGFVGTRCTRDGQYTAWARTLSEAVLCGATYAAYQRWRSETIDQDDDEQGEPTMRRTIQNVTCPHSAHLATICHETRPGGKIVRVEACTAFDPCTDVRCDQECARRLNQRLEATRTQPRCEQPEPSTERDAP
jgi:hypothetical protein